MSNDERGVVDFGAQDKEYADKIKAAKGGYVPVGGAPMPAIPRLDTAPPDKNQRAPIGPEALLTPEQKAQLEKEGKLIPGIGSAYKANQPFKESQPPNEEGFVNPPRPEGSGLRPETLQQLEGFASASKKSEAVPEKEEDKIAKDLDDGMDFNQFNAQVRTLINNKKRREAIESRITDKIDIEDLLVHQELRQQVPIIPGKFVPTYRSVGGHEDIWIKRQMGSETGSETYIVDRYAMMNLVCGLYAINGKILPNHLDKDGFVDEKVFQEKYRAVLRYPFQVLADLSINYVWFTQRCERALVVDDIKGF